MPRFGQRPFVARRRYYFKVDGSRYLPHAYAAFRKMLPSIRRTELKFITIIIHILLNYIAPQINVADYEAVGFGFIPNILTITTQE
jgi:hypothetical protein